MGRVGQRGADPDMLAVACSRIACCFRNMKTSLLAKKAKTSFLVIPVFTILHLLALVNEKILNSFLSN